MNVDDRPSNRLADQHSAYLRAHSHDPVNWRPWGAKAFKRAVKLDRPIFLSIGYESCHWCHVMQRESFQDPDISGFLNRQFVCVKVDRELRPDIDTLYQMYVGTVTGSGGWPLSAFLLPDGSPFFGGTYFPKTSPRPEMPGFGNVMASIMQAWVLER
ncbi:MAG: thioredoxin domain-containing protein, partial [Actinomycetota bacterium]|nr:thioredoxin domain-containing protein [Actinomycetota bacterium]